MEDIYDKEEHMPFKTQEIKAQDTTEKGNSIGHIALPWSGVGDLARGSTWEKQLNGIPWTYFFSDLLKLPGSTNFLLMVISEAGSRGKNQQFSRNLLLIATFYGN